jgi:hypothetical protein
MVSVDIGRRAIHEPRERACGARDIVRNFVRTREDFLDRDERAGGLEDVVDFKGGRAEII